MNNNINLWQKIFAGILLIAFTVIPAFLIIGYWPDRLPTAGDSNSGWYHFKLLHVELIKGAKADSTDNNNSGDSSANNITVHVKVDTPVKENSDSNEISTKNQAETWYVAGLIGYSENDAAYKKALLNQRFDTIAKGNAILESYDYFKNALKLDQLPDAKG